MEEGERKSGWGPHWLLVLLGLALVAVAALIYGAMGREADYRELLERRDELLRELGRLSAMRAEGRISEAEYERRRRAIVRDVENIERKLDEAERGSAFE